MLVTVASVPPLAQFVVAAGAPARAAVRNGRAASMYSAATPALASMPDAAASTATGWLWTAVESFSASDAVPPVEALAGVLADAGDDAVFVAGALAGANVAAPLDETVWFPELLPDPPPPPQAPRLARASAVANVVHALSVE